MLRGDDDLFALMESMGDNAGYNADQQDSPPAQDPEPPTPIPSILTKTKTTKTKTTKTTKTKRKRSSSQSKKGGNELWNPSYVHHNQSNNICTSSVHPSVELLRHSAFESLKSSLLAYCTRKAPEGLKVKKSWIEEWWFGRKSEEDSVEDGYDSVMVTPTGTHNGDDDNNDRKNSSSMADSALCTSVIGSPGGKKRSKFLSGIRAIVQSEHSTFRKTLSSSRRTVPKKGPQIIPASDNSGGGGGGGGGGVVQVKYMGKILKLNSAYLEKLRILHERSSLPASDFNSDVFSLLLRYDTLEGAGFQASIPPRVFDVLLEEFGAGMEMFASPLNCRYSRFCSAFPDVDGVFGSAGSVWKFEPKEGCFEANPPFEEGVITRMASHFERLLREATGDLKFIIIVPRWPDKKSWQRLNESTATRQVITVNQKDHYYCEGTRYRRGGDYRVASFDTSVFFWEGDKVGDRVGDRVGERVGEGGERWEGEEWERKERSLREAWAWNGIGEKEVKKVKE